MSTEDITTLVQLSLMLMLLSADNVAIIAAKSLKVPARKLGKRRIGGLFSTEQEACLHISLGGALCVRCLMAVGASWVASYPGIKLLGACLLVVLAVGFVPRLAIGPLVWLAQMLQAKASIATFGLPGVLAAIVAMDASASLDNVLAAVSLTTNSALIVLATLLAGVPGLLLGKHMVRLIAALPSLQWSARLLAISIGVQMILGELIGFRLSYLDQFLVSGMVIGIPVVLAGVIDDVKQLLHEFSEAATREGSYAALGHRRPN